MSRAPPGTRMKTMMCSVSDELSPLPKYADLNADLIQAPFSYGQRSCLGRSLASMETRVCLARLILGFDMELMEDSHDWNQQKVYLLYEKRPLNVKLTEVFKSEKGVLVS